MLLMKRAKQACYIPRILLAHRGKEGGDLARILCGQTSPQIAKAYEVHAARVAKGQIILGDIQGKLLRPVRHSPPPAPMEMPTASRLT